MLLNPVVFIWWPCRLPIFDCTVIYLCHLWIWSLLRGAVNPAQILGTHWTCTPERRPTVRWVVLEQRISFSFSHPVLIKALWRTELVYINSLASLGRDSECPWMGSVRIVAGPKRLLGIISNHWVRSLEWDRESAHSPAIWVVLVRERQAHPVEFMRFGILVMKKFAESIHA